jgi:acyl-CoA thioester hydrolase
MIKTKIKVRFEDIDALGHLNNAKFFTYLEEGRIALFEKIRGKFSLDQVDFVVKYLEGNFIEPIYLGSEVTIRVEIEKIGNTSITLKETIWYNNKLCFEGKCVLVFYDFKKGTKKSIPEDVLDKIKEETKKES